ncbi:MAG: indole-3-glycerol-phosphate synthase [Spirochaetes bacterium]|nr:indole-3-glycerol-phosphate synthase [Spirochaetota bacterium]
MNGVLRDIIELKRAEAMRAGPGKRQRRRGIFRISESLTARPFIAEVKKASPSAGVISPGADPCRQAEEYRKGGAGAISVLTESTYFKGSFRDLEQVSSSVDAPVLCKDFIVHEHQIHRAYECGADAVLLIVSILTEREIRRLTAVALALGLQVLHEIHRIDEFERIRRVDLSMVGVNARDLDSFEVDLEAAANTMRLVRGEFLKVAESGIATAGDVRTMRSAGADAFLVGTALMRAGDPAGELRRLYGGLEETCS